ncbi:MAG TPA: hypothetical protein VGB01_02210, partial [candidate division Zixibacteria bacterium]
MQTKSQELSNVDVAVYALFRLEGARKKVHTEHIAWEAYNLAKDRFSWSLPEFRSRGFPDKTTVRYALESAKKEKLVKGRAGRDKGGRESEGWLLTPAGLDWIKENVKRIEMALHQVPSSDVPRHEAERFIKKIKSERIFREFLERSNLDGASPYDLTDMLSCTPDAPKD